jgi:hypothetical protein
MWEILPNLGDHTWKADKHHKCILWTLGGAYLMIGTVVKEQILCVARNLSAVSESNLKQTSSILLCHKRSHPLTHVLLPAKFLFLDKIASQMLETSQNYELVHVKSWSNWLFSIESPMPTEYLSCQPLATRETTSTVLDPNLLNKKRQESIKVVIQHSISFFIALPTLPHHGFLPNDSRHSQVCCFYQWSHHFIGLHLPLCPIPFFVTIPEHQNRIGTE